MHRIYVVSDATAETAERSLRAALFQFRGVDADIRIFSMVRGEEHLLEILELAVEHNALVVYTVVNPGHREYVAERAEALGVTVVDLIGNLMRQLGAFVGLRPAGSPRVNQLTDEYFRRIEAVEFSVKHDDGQAMRNLHAADIVLVGISRTSKTPLSTFLAQKGWKVANVPLVLGLPIPRELDTVDVERVFGLTIDVATLIRIRRARLQTLHMPPDTEYARRDHIIKELDYARALFSEHPEWPVIDVSRKAIEETAGIILQIIDERRRQAV